MTRDPAAQAVHERFGHLVATMPDPDVEAGWAALVAQLEPPVAPVVPLRRRRRPWRGAVLGVAAAMAIAGAAFAAVHHAGAEQPPVTRRPSVSVAPHETDVGPHAHPALSGPPAEPQPTPSVPHHHHETSTTTGGSTHSNGGSDGVPSGSTHHATQPSHHDSPDDTDHGTGNDGSHDDNGQGNDAQGQDSQGNDNGSSGGSGNDLGSGSGQGAGDRGTHGGERPSGAGGSDGDHGTSHGQGGGHGSNH